MSFSPEQQAAWDDWVAGRPESVQASCRMCPPDKQYRLRTTNQLVQVESFYEDGTIRVTVLPTMDPFIPVPYGVFGVDPHDLVPADEAHDLHSPRSV